MRVSIPKLKVYKDGEKRYRVDLAKSYSRERPRPKRVRRFFPTEELAKVFIRTTEKQHRKFGTQVPFLPIRDVIDADEAIQILRRGRVKPRPKLRDLALDCVERWKAQHKSTSLGHLFDRFMEDREDQKRAGQKHLGSVRQTKKKFERWLARKASELTADDVEDVLWKLTPSSYNGHLKRLKSVLRYGFSQGALPDEALTKRLGFRKVTSKPLALPPAPVEVVERMLRIAEAEMPKLLPFLTISLFTGVRPEELQQIEMVRSSLR